ncbi:MAG: SUMF1/EgtB/PvdO family nonheme iron enzyme [Acidobacteriota bacterium]|nr:MAG: SUMF1/EgtB/PvdO family nonheme iron enzyme [Acidobacteriota bacterium]
MWVFVKQPLGQNGYSHAVIAADGEPVGFVRVTSEEEIAVGSSNGALSQPKAEDVGGISGPVPEAFPKGFRHFYLMKYEMTQGQYAAMLNTVSDSDSFARANFNSRSYYGNRGTIGLQDGQFVAGKPDRPMNFVTWDDSLAFADWAGLRPMTELEFSKAARGSRSPIENEYPWGTGTTDGVARMVGVNDDLVLSNGSPNTVILQASAATRSSQ